MLHLKALATIAAILAALACAKGSRESEPCCSRHPSKNTHTEPGYCPYREAKDIGPYLHP